MQQSELSSCSSPVINRNSGRVAWVDTFRALMIFAIVWGHALGVESQSSDVIIRYLYSFHVPAFFFVSGFLFNNSNISFGSFVLKKIRSLMIPYYVFSILSIAIFSVLGSVASDGLGVAVKTTDILPNICGMLYASGATGYMKWNLPMWFVPCLFCATVLFYGLKAVLDKTGRRIGVNLAMAGLLSVTVILAVLNYYVFHISKLPFGFETVIYMLPFFVVGYWIRQSVNLNNIPAAKRLIAGIILVCVGTVLGVCMQSHVSYTSSQYDNILVFYIAAFSSVVGFVLIVQNLSYKWLNYIGQNTLPILLMHKFPIVLLQMLLLDYIGASIIGDVFITLLISVVACALSLLAGKIIKSIAPFALGAKHSKRLSK